MSKAEPEYDLSVTYLCPPASKSVRQTWRYAPQILNQPHSIYYAMVTMFLKFALSVKRLLKHFFAEELSRKNVFVKENRLGFTKISSMRIFFLHYINFATFVRGEEI